MSNEVVLNALTSEVKSHASKANAIATELRAARDSNPEKSAKTFVTKSELPEVPEAHRSNVEKFRAAEAKALAAIEKSRNDLIAAIVADLPKTSLGEDVVAAKTAEYKTHAEAFRTYRKSIVDLPDLATPEQVEALPKLLTIGGGKSTGGTHAGAGRPKPRFSEITLDGHSVAKMVGDKRVCTPTVLSEKINSLHLNEEGWNKVTSAELVTEVFAVNESTELTGPVTLTSFRGKHAVVFTPKDANAAE